MDKKNHIAGKITGVHVEKIDISGSFLDMAACFAKETGTVCLMSGGDLDCARYHMLALKPWLTFTSRDRFVKIGSEDQEYCFQEDPLEALREVLDECKLDEKQYSQNKELPVFSGFFGYFAYDLKDHIEKLPRTSIDDLKIRCHILNSE